MGVLKPDRKPTKPNIFFNKFENRTIRKNRCMFVCVDTYMHTCVHIYLLTHIPTYLSLYVLMSVYMFVCLSLYQHTHTHTHTHSHARAHTHIHTRALIHAHAHTHTRARARTHTHMFTKKSAFLFLILPHELLLCHIVTQMSNPCSGNHHVITARRPRYIHKRPGDLFHKLDSGRTTLHHAIPVICPSCLWHAWV